MRAVICATAALALSACVSAPRSEQTTDLGLFESASDIGDVGAPGQTQYDAATGIYRLTGAGENMWETTDAFHFVWTRIPAGDVSIAADIAFEGEGAHGHRKAGVMIRQSLDPAAAYADLVVHGDGLTAVQYRNVAGARTQQIIAPVTAAERLRLEREGAYVYFSLGGEDGQWRRIGAPVRVDLNGDIYVGLALCSHVRGHSERARFSNVVLNTAAIPVVADTGYPAQVESTLEILYLGQTQYGPDARRVVAHFDHKIEAPNWTRDGSSLIYNDRGLIYRMPVEGGAPARIETGPLTRNNNDHGISPDGTQLIVSDNSGPGGLSRIHLLPIGGSATPRLVAEHPQGYSYWHAWSPDGATIVYTANRPDFGGDYDLYARELASGPDPRFERNLTRNPGLDDGPDYTPDGRWIYFNSTRSGHMKIWRMRPDGSNPEQVTFDSATRDWFPHPSPDGKWIAFISFGLDIDLSDHPPNRDVVLQLMPLDGGAPPRVIARLFGGQGTINVPSWSPDSTRLAFVSYRLKDGKAPLR